MPASEKKTNTELQKLEPTNRHTNIQKKVDRMKGLGLLLKGKKNKDVEISYMYIFGRVSKYTLFFFRLFGATFWKTLVNSSPESLSTTRNKHVGKVT